MLVLGCFAVPAIAGVTTDGTLGAAQTLSGPNYAITQALGQTVGSNLFHSFGAFSLVSGEKATKLWKRLLPTVWPSACVIA